MEELTVRSWTGELTKQLDGRADCKELDGRADCKELDGRAVCKELNERADSLEEGSAEAN